MIHKFRIQNKKINLKINPKVKIIHYINLVDDQTNLKFTTGTGSESKSSKMNSNISSEELNKTTPPRTKSLISTSKKKSNKSRKYYKTFLT